jgi:hypothetical protein
MKTNLIKLIAYAVLFGGLLNLSAQVPAVQTNSVAWDQAGVSQGNPGDVSYYDVVITTTNSTAASLGSSTNVVSSPDLIATARPTLTQIRFSALTTNQLNGNYFVWVRAMGTNGLISPWSTNLHVRFTIPQPPTAPTNLRVIP